MGSSQYASTMAFVGVAEGKPPHKLTLRPIPVFGMRWNHRMVALTFGGVVFVEWLFQASGGGCPTVAHSGWQVLAFIAWVFTLFILWYAHAAPNFFLLLLKITHYYSDGTSARLNKVLVKARRILRRAIGAIPVVLFSYALALALIWVAAHQSGLVLNLSAFVLISVMTVLCATLPPYGIFKTYKRDRFQFKADENDRYRRPTRNDLNELALVLHKRVSTDGAYARELVKQIIAPTRTMHAAITGTRNLDRVQSGLTTFLLRSQFDRDPIMQIMLIGYPIFGGWLVLFICALFRAVSSAALGFGALALGALTAAFLAQVQQKLTAMMTLSAEERESFPAWAAPATHQFSETGNDVRHEDVFPSDAAASTQASEDRGLSSVFAAKSDGAADIRLVSWIGGAVYGVLFVGFLTMLSAAQLDTRQDRSGIGAPVFGCSCEVQFLSLCLKKKS